MIQTTFLLIMLKSLERYLSDERHHFDTWCSAKGDPYQAIYMKLN